MSAKPASTVRSPKNPRTYPSESAEARNTAFVSDCAVPDGAAQEHSDMPMTSAVNTASIDLSLIFFIPFFLLEL